MSNLKNLSNLLFIKFIEKCDSSRSAFVFYWELLYFFTIQKKYDKSSLLIDCLALRQTKKDNSPSGKLSILSWMSAAVAAFIISSSDADGRPYAMLYFISVLNSTVSCGTIPIAFLSVSCFTCVSKSQLIEQTITINVLAFVAFLTLDLCS